MGRLWVKVARPVSGRGDRGLRVYYGEYRFLCWFEGLGVGFCTGLQKVAYVDMWCMYMCLDISTVFDNVTVGILQKIKRNFRLNVLIKWKII